MQVFIKPQKFKASDLLLEKVAGKIGDLTKIYDRIERSEVILKREKNDRRQQCIVEVRLTVPKTNLFAKEQSEGFLRSLDRVVLDLKKQLVHYKTKRDLVRSKEKI